MHIPGLPESLPECAFLLMVQTQHMRQMYEKHAGKVLCVDPTYGTMQHRFSLVAAVVADEHGEGETA